MRYYLYNFASKWHYVRSSIKNKNFDFQFFKRRNLKADLNSLKWSPWKCYTGCNDLLEKICFFWFSLLPFLLACFLFSYVKALENVKVSRKLNYVHTHFSLVLSSHPLYYAFKYILCIRGWDINLAQSGWMACSFFFLPHSMWCYVVLNSFWLSPHYNKFYIEAEVISFCVCSWDGFWWKSWNFLKSFGHVLARFTIHLFLYPFPFTFFPFFLPFPKLNSFIFLSPKNCL